MGMSISASRASSVTMSQPVNLRPAAPPPPAQSASNVLSQAPKVQAANLDAMVGSLLDTSA